MTLLTFYRLQLEKSPLSASRLQHMQPFLWSRRVVASDLLEDLSQFISVPIQPEDKSLK